MAKYYVTTECDARLIEEWCIGLPDDYPRMLADEKGEAVWEALEHGEAELLSETGYDEREREITLGPKRVREGKLLREQAHEVVQEWLGARRRTSAGAAENIGWLLLHWRGLADVDEHGVWYATAELDEIERFMGGLEHSSIPDACSAMAGD
jgi:hypothetical protein